MPQSFVLSTYYPPAHRSPNYPPIYPPIHPPIYHLPASLSLSIESSIIYFPVYKIQLSKYSCLYLCVNFPTCPTTFLLIDLSIYKYLVQFSAQNVLCKTARTIAYISSTVQNREMTVTVALPYTKMRELCDKSSDSNCCKGIISQVMRRQRDRHTDRHIHITFSNTFT
jgi:hypothetical protein